MLRGRTRWRTSRALKREQRLPAALSRDEVRRLFSVVTIFEHCALFMVACDLLDSGSRIISILSVSSMLNTASGRAIRVRQGKGHKDRYWRLTPELLKLLREYWRAYRPPAWLFPGASPEKQYKTTWPRRGTY